MKYLYCTWGVKTRNNIFLAKGKNDTHGNVDRERNDISVHSKTFSTWMTNGNTQLYIIWNGVPHKLNECNNCSFTLCASSNHLLAGKYQGSRITHTLTKKNKKRLHYQANWKYWATPVIGFFFLSVQIIFDSRPSTNPGRFLIKR